MLVQTTPMGWTYWPDLCPVLGENSLHSHWQRGCHCRMAASGKASQPSKSNPCPLAAARRHGTISKVGPCGGAYFWIFVILVCSLYSSFLFFNAYTTHCTWIYRQRRGCAAYFGYHQINFLRRSWGGGSGMSCLASQKPDIPSYFGISKAIIKYKILNQV